MFKKISSLIISLTLASVLFAPVTPVFAQNPPVADTSQQNDISSRIGSCDFSNWTPCILEFYMWAILSPSYWLVGIAGQMFDFFIQYSIDSNSYSATSDGVSFVEKGWGIIRDMVNIMFLFILLYIAIKHILGSGGSNTKKLLINLIFVAIVINFSLFFTRIIIDAGNVLARVFYRSIEVENDGQDNGYTSISVGLVGEINPQKILDSNLLNPTLIPGNNSALDVNNLSSKPNQGYMFLIFILATVVNLTLMLTFISVSILLIGRVIGLWMLMMFSPIAFISMATPIGSFGKLSFDSWLKNVVSLSFMAPVFLFFMFLLIMFLDVVLGTQDSFQGTTIQNLMKVVVPFIFIIFLVNFAKKTAKEMAGEFGDMVSKYANSALTGSLAVAGAGLGATAWLGRNTVGRVAGGVLNSGVLQNSISKLDQNAQKSTGLKRFGFNTLKKITEGTESLTSSAYNSNMDLRSGRAGKIIGYAGGKAISGINLATGEKINLNLGKPAKAKDVARKNYEEKVEKDALKIAQRRSEFTDREKSAIENGTYKPMEEYEKELQEMLASGKINEKQLKEKREAKKQEILQDRRNAAARTYEKEIIPENLFKVGAKNRAETAEKIRKGKKEKTDAEKFEEILDKKAKEIAKKEKEESGGDDASGGGGVKSGAAAPAGGGGGGDSTGPKANFETEKVVDAIKDLGSDIRGAGNPTFSPGANINSRGGGFNTERTMAGFGDRGTSTPNENSQPVGFKQNEDKTQ